MRIVAKTKYDADADIAAGQGAAGNGADKCSGLAPARHCAQGVILTSNNAITPPSDTGEVSDNAPWPRL